MAVYCLNPVFAHFAMSVKVSEGGSFPNSHEQKMQLTPEHENIFP